jgi:cell division protein FtsB
MHPVPEWEDAAMRNLTLAIAAVLACAASPALAQDGEPPNVPSRYSFSRIDDGFLRLDNLSGQVAFCSPHAVGWACQAVPEDRAALEKEIARLQDEVASLKQEVATLREPPPPRPPADLTPTTTDQSEDAARLREDLARARTAFENAWRRLVDMIINFQKDMMRKG